MIAMLDELMYELRKTGINKDFNITDRQKATNTN